MPRAGRMAKVVRRFHSPFKHELGAIRLPPSRDDIRGAGHPRRWASVSLRPAARKLPGAAPLRPCPRPAGDAATRLGGRQLPAGARGMAVGNSEFAGT